MIRNFLGVLLATLASVLVLSGPAAATPAKETPWLPEAGAYRLTLFLGNLEPLPWDDIETAWREPYRGSEFSIGALAWLDRESDIDAAQLLNAITHEDRQAVFAEATRLIALRIEEELNRAVAAEDPAHAQQAVRTARELYRAFADGIATAEPDVARQIGLAWLELNSSTGSAGVLGAGVTSADRDTMAAARRVISGYIAENYLIADFAPRQTLSALPETAILSGRAIEVPPSLPPGSDIFDQDPLPRLVLNFEEQGIDETDLPLVAYGDMLFDSAQIFGSPARDLGLACSTCHNRSDVNQRLFIPGASHQPGAIDVDGAFFNPIFNDRRSDPLDIPSLRGLRFTGPYGRDGRFASLRDFTRNVVVNEFGGAEPTPFMMDALVAYMLEFDFLPNSMLTPDGQLTESAPEAAQRGEAIFNTPFAGLGDRSCASCHMPDANFLDRQAHDIGSVAPAYEGARAGALDTPTLLGTAYTAPYFHDGSLPTLAAVVDWFDETKTLGLTEAERTDLTAYLQTVGAADEPYEAFDAENTAFGLAFAELTTFASTIDTLLPRRDVRHILLLTDTVAADLSADASTMSNLAARPDVYALAEKLAEVGTAVRDGDWAAAEASWSAFQTEADTIEARAF
ncbi:Cytochrome c peroxidase [Pseudosulfitobacter pseudonitzschiae]|uniref:Cytochrome C n=1 Tax=Pseudosulfitobacter pseudonitzschiae TaxID=1402135 RepID=A0A073IVV1_9RHOB|nr:cytochrome C [Pseudosulfitobacter pseudonitzschiae]QKS10941.1 cytochrome C [Pseudosulfitobacter pseudonitzschiae]SHG12011.1 Cytochrome c peroxidase [Pseudosulfitobacter pseudonitzschiae]